MSKFIILGDVHLGKGTSLGKNNLGFGINSRIQDQLKILDWVMHQAIDNHVSDIFVTGDIFEEPKPPLTLINLFISWLKDCNLHNVNIHIGLGNHDILRHGNSYVSSLDIIGSLDLSNTFVYSNLSTVYIGNYGIIVAPFKDRKSLFCNTNQEAADTLKTHFEYEISSIPNFCKKIMIGHFALEGSIFIGDEINDLVNEIFCSPDMLKGLDYVWMGHVHKPQVMQEQPYIAHIGSMDISDFGECDHEKYIIIFDTETDSFVHKTIPTRKLKKIQISIPQDVEDGTAYILDYIKSNEIDDAIVSLNVSTASDNTKINKTQIEKTLISNGAFNISSFSQSKKINIIKKQGNEEFDVNIDVSSALNKYAKDLVPEDLNDTFLVLAKEIVSQQKEHK